MIGIKSPREIELMRKAGEITGETLKYLATKVKPGITTKELDKLAEDFVLKKVRPQNVKVLKVFQLQYVYQLTMRLFMVFQGLGN